MSDPRGYKGPLTERKCNRIILACEKLDNTAISRPNDLLSYDGISEHSLCSLYIASSSQRCSLHLTHWILCVFFCKGLLVRDIRDMEQSPCPQWATAEETEVFLFVDAGSF